MDTHAFDWKDVANAQFDRAFTFAVLVILFLVMVTPRVDVKKQQITQREIQVEQLPPDEIKKMEQPAAVKPVVDVVINDELGGKEADNIAIDKVLGTLGGSITDVNNNVLTKKNDDDERAAVFTVYEEAPEPINPTAPEYPKFAKDNKIQGKVILQVDVFKDGSVGNVVVLQSLLAGPGGLDEAAIDAVKKWKFQPGKSGGRPVDTRVVVPIQFSLTN